MATPISALENRLNRGVINPAENLPRRQPRFTVIEAEDEKTRRRCLELRYDVFATELGASLSTQHHQIDMDRFDPFCHHLAVIDNQTSEIIATTRLLDNPGSEQTNGFYSETEFNLQNILRLNKQFCEVGRTCIHPDYRRGSALLMLWQGIARFVVRHNIDYLFGCASIPFSSGDRYLNNIMRHLRDTHFAPAELQVRPHIPLRLNEVQGKTDDVMLPTLLRAYLRQGALVCGEPYWDAAFGVVDVFVLLDSMNLNRSYQQHFIERI